MDISMTKAEDHQEEIKKYEEDINQLTRISKVNFNGKPIEKIIDEIEI